MDKIQLYFLLRKNKKLSEKRNVMFEANQYGKFFAYLGFAFFVVYFIAIGTFLGWAAVNEDEYQLLFVTLPFILLLDFFGRFMTQQTPVMLVKPYLLMPVSKYTAIECFLVSQLFDVSNLTWMALFLPYTFICVCGNMTLIQGFAMLLLLHLMILTNSQWYLLVRTLVNKSLYWWALPVAFYGSVILPFFLLSDRSVEKYFDKIFDFIEEYAFSWYAFVLFIVLFIILFLINRKLQMYLVYDEISKHERTKMKHVSEFAALNRFGQIGEYLKLEIKSTMRNKAIRTRFLQGVVIITILSLMIAYTDAYTGGFARNMWCLYCFVFFGAVNLVKVMGPEGNYIDLLMVHEENILTLLRAKYYFYCAIVLLPFILLLPPIISGKFSLLMVLAYLLITTGPEYCLLFQLAIWNKTTLPLNDKITGKNQFENKLQLIIELIVFFVPVALVLILQALFNDTVAYTVMIVIGLAFTIATPYWMRNIYQRMMRHRYENLEGFHSTR
ncbi:MAG: hypothetical protein IJ888_01365 [Prevotella sp.]|nr:hypothetical protein [Prevotella sp.]